MITCLPEPSSASASASPPMPAPMMRTVSGLLVLDPFVAFTRSLRHRRGRGLGLIGMRGDRNRDAWRRRRVPAYDDLAGLQFAEARIQLGVTSLKARALELIDQIHRDAVIAGHRLRRGMQGTLHRGPAFLGGRQERLLLVVIV